MSVKSDKVKVIGFFGQSGAGKTTIIRNVKGPINGHLVRQNTGIIRYLFQRNDGYTSPVELLQKYEADLAVMKPAEKSAKIDEIYEKYIRSQFQLLNDFSTEVYYGTRVDNCSTNSFLLIDRSPIDFYTLTVCGVAYLKDELGKAHNANCQKLIDLVRKTAETNTRNFFDGIMITKPWKAEGGREFKDGIRDQYLGEHYAGENWYNKADDINLEGIPQYTIDEKVTDLFKRAEIVELCLQEV
jgi:energy-coupling factor transporter ATP-binding protein EcfA2